MSAAARRLGGSTLGGLLLAVVFSGCYASHGASERPEDAGASVDGGRDADAGVDAGADRFAGRWLVHQPFHALYEATVYELRADGRVFEECNVSLGGEPLPGEGVTLVGVVTRDADGLSCRFAGAPFSGRWASRHEGELAIDVECDDGMQRVAVFAVSWSVEDFSRLEPDDIVLVKVGGEEGWSRPIFAWQWLRCELDLAICDCG